MTIKSRRIIYSSIIIVFLVITPILILYSSGYRYDFKKKEFVKTGSLILDSYPKGAEIYLNGKPYQNLFSGGTWKTLFRLAISGWQEKRVQRTPLIINNLLPNEYLVEIKKSGYKPWLKKLNIKPRMAEFVDYILLFLEQPEIKILSETKKLKISQTKISSDQKKIAFTTNEQLYILDLKTGRENLLFTATSSITDISWDYSNKKILITEEKWKDKKYSVIEIGNNIKYLDQFKNYVALENLKWDSQNQYILFGKKDNIIYQVNLLNQKFYPFLRINTSDIIADYFIKDLDIFYLKKEKDNLCLKEVVLVPAGETLRIKKSSRDCLVELPFSSESTYKISALKDDLILVENQKEQEMYLINLKDKKIILKARAKENLFLDELQVLVYWNDFEIWEVNLQDYNPEKGSSLSDRNQILTRFSYKIKQITFRPSGKYLFFTLEDKDKKNTLQVIESNIRDKKNIFKLLETSNINNIFFSREKDYIYMWGDFKGQDGIYQVKIQ